MKYQENRNDITQIVEIDLTNVTDQGRQDLKRGVTECLKQIDAKHQHIFRFEGKNTFSYDTEVLIPRVNKNRLNVLMVLGNPAIHSVAEKMFFSHEGPEGKRREHRFWRVLNELKVVELDIFNPTPEYNNHKRECLLNGNYHSDLKFNIFLLPYFSFPTPASRKSSDIEDLAGVKGIKKIVGKEIFDKMKKCEFKRFEGIVLNNDIKHIICFQKTDARKEIVQKEDKPICNILDNEKYPVYRLGGDLKHVVLYTAPPTRALRNPKAKEILKGIVSDIRAKSRIG